jgi:uncharacterized protein
MRKRVTLFSFVILALACGRNRAVADPKQPTGPRNAETPLITAELATSADIAKAIREYYTKYEYLIPMRDGAKLHTIAYVPKLEGRKYPFMMMRTPYGTGPYGADNYLASQSPRTVARFAPSPRFIREGYIIVHQDVRGKFMSEGSFVDVKPHATVKGEVDESTDTYDSIDWLVKHVPNNNGNVGTWGISYPGFYAAQSAVNAHPALKAVSPQAPVTEWFMGDDFHHNGAFFMADALDFYVNFGKPRPTPTPKASWEFDHGVADVYDFYLGLGTLADASSRYMKGIPFWEDLMNHGTYDSFWKARDPRPHYRNVKPAVMTVGGFFDEQDVYGTLETYRSFEKQSPGSQNTIVMGPWTHGGWARNDGDHIGDVTFGQKTSLFYRDQIEFPFFDHHLRGGKDALLPEAYMFETGTNQWRAYAQWPPVASKQASLFLRNGFALSGETPTTTEAVDSYVSDPNKPVPYRERHSDRIEASYMVEDQRFAARRTDVLTYRSPALSTDLTLAGPIEAQLWVTTTGTDADFIVKLIDVYPENTEDPIPNPMGLRMGGFQQLVRGEIIRGKFRDSMERPTAFRPGEPSLVRFAIPDACHAFRAGHKLMIQIQSTWFPLVDRNPQKFTDIYHAKTEDFQPATHSIHHTATHPSKLTLTISSGSLPR